MTILALGLVLVGILLSAFFSGTETGFYRASRVRWVLDGIEGDRVSKLLLRLINEPTLYVSTSLVGNNLANYLISLAGVILAQHVAVSRTFEFIAPLMLTPFVFVYGELLPKSLFYMAPNRLLRKLGPLYLCCLVLFSPVVALLWILGRMAERFLGQSPEKVRLTLARTELNQVLKEGQEVGLLQPIQRRMGQNFFLIASRPVGQLCVPLHRLHSLPRDATRRQAMSHAQRFELPTLVLHGERRSELLGYVRTVDLILAKNSTESVDGIRPMLSIRAQEHCGEALMRMQSQRAEIAQVVNEKGQPLGVISLDDLTRPLLATPAD